MARRTRSKSISAVRIRDDHGEPPLATAAAHHTYDSPLVERYASREMLRIFSPQHRHATWRRIWVALAEAQAELGLAISKRQLAELRAAVDRIDFAAAARYERQTRHDVMAHIHAFGDAAPAARGIIHLGATSMDIVDNADLLLAREALDLLARRLAVVVGVLADFCAAQADQPALGFTHLQPAQLTTVGKRAALWLADLVVDLERFVQLRDGLKCRGIRGATGTQASFLGLLKSPAKVARLERRFAATLGFGGCYPVCGQTYSRKVDVEIVSALGSFAAGVHKMCNDIRLLALLKEIDEPFEESQVGSSAMPYKRNPMLCERATGLARYLISLTSSPLMTHAAQMLERTLDDSSNKRLAMPDAFLTGDALTVILHRIVDGLVVYPATIEARIAAELPFIASEDILMAAVARGGDRQALHERIRAHAQAAGEQVKLHGKPNDLIERLKRDPAFAQLDWSRVLDAHRHVGLAPAQTRAFLARHVRPLLRRLKLALPSPSAIVI
jgi:adenylosuccinate lyase